jgi:hypothetical protein
LKAFVDKYPNGVVKINKIIEILKQKVLITGQHHLIRMRLRVLRKLMWEN